LGAGKPEDAISYGSVWSRVTAVVLWHMLNRYLHAVAPDQLNGNRPVGCSLENVVRAARLTTRVASEMP